MEEHEMRHGRSPYARAHLTDAVGAAAVAAQEVLGALDADARTEDVSEKLELGTAQPLARSGRIAHRAVVLDEDVPVVVGHDLGQISLRGS
jgi:hypothetical protein